jgi:ABC-type Zn2+ transport system substrate-binding protein/surface adhesin
VITLALLTTPLIGMNLSYKNYQTANVHQNNNHHEKSPHTHHTHHLNHHHGHHQHVLAHNSHNLPSGTVIHGTTNTVAPLRKNNQEQFTFSNSNSHNGFNVGDLNLGKTATIVSKKLFFIFKKFIINCFLQ